MSDIIRLLPDHVANQIAAGEVIQRPASVVKELLENAIDAGSKHIQVIIKEAGKALIHVIDDGVGMSTTDARMSFERHATSKIQDAKDLFSISTKGFRGEALASIASVALVEMRTKRAQDEVGTKIKVEGSHVSAQEPLATTNGTDIRVKNLFFNIPARRKFLKSDPAEFKHIVTEFNRICLAHPDIQFELMHNDRLVSKMLAEGLKRRIIGVLGKKYDDKLLQVDEDTEVVKVSGFITTADAAKARRDDAYFFVNGRYFKSPYFHHAVSTAYGQLLPDGRHPTYVIYLEVDPDRLDVNVHPTKQEIKFEDGQVIYNFLRAATRQTLAQHHMVPTVNFDPPPEPFRSSGGGSGGGSSMPIDPRHRPGDWEKAFEGFTEGLKDDAKSEPLPDLFHEMNDTPAHPLGRVIGGWPGYVLALTADSILAVDQRSAHVRVLYEDLLKRLQSAQGEVQGLVFPETIDLTAEQMSTYQYLEPYLRSVGYDTSAFGGQSIIVHGVPAIQQWVTAEAGELLTILEHKVDELKVADPAERIAEHMAQHMAMRRDRELTSAEQQQLVDQLAACTYHDRTPQGQRCYTILNKDEIIQRLRP